MEMQLINGLFTIGEAEDLLTALFNTKIQFHENKIGWVHTSEEDIKNTERRILQLKDTLRSAIQQMKESGSVQATLTANIVVEMK
jgi:hypothetical protein